jgi:hypothetical protein
MSKDFEEVARFVNPFEAHQAVAVLSRHGLQAFIEGENSNSTLWYVGSAIGGVRVLVPAAYKAQARELLEASGTETTKATDGWICSNCFAEVDPGFDVCWRCGHEQNERCQTIQSSSASNNVTASTRESATTDAAQDSVDVDDLVRRAWRASVIGNILIPIVAHVYSLSLLMQAYPKLQQASQRTRRLALAALLVDILAIVFFTMVLRILLIAPIL